MPTLRQAHDKQLRVTVVTFYEGAKEKPRKEGTMEIYGMQKDMEAFGKLIHERQERIAKASAEPVRDDPMNALARRLHPERIDLVIAEVREETATTRTFRLRPALGTELPVFRAGQYLSLKVPIGDSWLTRPYAITSAPHEA